MALKSTAPSWEQAARRVVIQTANYLDFDGSYSAGGRQRFIRDIALEIQAWGREVLVVQKGHRAFEVSCPQGLPVVGLRAGIDTRGDLCFAYRARRVLRPGDVCLYASGEDAWPFFAAHAKAIQHGVWWDGPKNAFIRGVQRQRALGMMRAVDSTLCVDTNFINWLRTQGPTGYRLATKCRYIPNYVDLSQLGTTHRHPGEPLRILAARRFEEKRGTLLLLEALAQLRGTGIPFSAHICTVGGVAELRGRVQVLGLLDQVTVSEESMHSVLAFYPRFHVAVVPTLWSEGTSLAAVEALAAGLPLVVTPVGGLGNLVVPQFNGLIVEPTADALAGALTELAEDAAWQGMHAHALSMRHAFGMERWKGQLRPWLAQ